MERERTSERSSGNRICEGNMKTLKEIKESGRISVESSTVDGGYGSIHLFNWSGSVIWSCGGGWEHVSVSPYKKKIVPSWDDMCKIKDIFFRDEECAVQYHPPKNQYVNIVPNCLHLWKPINEVLPQPPSIMVGVRKGQSMESIVSEARTVLRDSR